MRATSTFIGPRYFTLFLTLMPVVLTSAYFSPGTVYGASPNPNTKPPFELKVPPEAAKLNKKEAIKYMENLSEQASVETLRAVTKRAEPGVAPYAKYLSLEKDAAAIAVSIYGWNNDKTASALISLANAFDANNDWNTSLWCRRRAIAIYKANQGERSFDCRSALDSLKTPLHELGRHDEEIETEKNIVSLTIAKEGKLSDDHVYRLYWLANVYQKHDMFPEFENTLMEGVAIWEASRFPDFDNVKDCISELIDHYKRKRKPDKVREWNEKLTSVQAEANRRMIAAESKTKDKKKETKEEIAASHAAFEETQKRMLLQVYGDSISTLTTSFEKLIQIAEVQPDKDSAAYFREQLQSVNSHKLLDFTQYHSALQVAEAKLLEKKKIDELVAVKREHAATLRKLKGENALAWLLEKEAADAEEQRGRYANAEVIYRELIERLSTNKDPESVKTVAETQSRLGRLFEKEAAGTAIGADSTTLFSKAAGIEPGEKEKHYKELASRYLEQGQPQLAEEAFRFVIAADEKQVQEKYVDLFRLYLACDYGYMGDCLRLQKKFSEAEKFYQKSLEVFDDLARPGHRDDTDKAISTPAIAATYKAVARMSLKLNYPAAISRFGENYLDAGDPEKAQVYFHRGLKIAKDSFKTGTALSPHLLGIARSLEAQNKLTEAEGYYRQNNAISPTRNVHSQKALTLARHFVVARLKQPARSSLRVVELVSAIENTSIPKETRVKHLQELKAALGKNSDLQAACRADICEYVAIVSNQLVLDDDVLGLLQEASSIRSKQLRAVAHTQSVIAAVVSNLGGSGEKQASAAFESYAREAPADDDFYNFETIMSLANLRLAQSDEQGALLLADRAFDWSRSKSKQISFAVDAKSIGDFFADNLDLGRAKSCYEAALKECNQPQQNNLKVQIELALARTNLQNGDWQISQRLLDEVLVLAKQPALLAEAIQLLSEIQSTEGRYDKAEQSAKEALNVATQAKINPRKYLLSLAKIQVNLKEYHEATVNLQLALQHVSDSDGDGNAAIYATLGDLYLRQKRVPESRQFALRALNHHKTKNMIVESIADELLVSRLHLLENETELARQHALEGAKLANIYISTVFPTLAFREQCAFSKFLDNQIGILLSCISDSNSAGQAYDFLMRWKGLLIESLRRQNQYLRLAGSANKDDLLELNTIRQNMSRISSQSNAKATSQLEGLSIEKVAAERALNRRFSNFNLSDPISGVDCKQFDKLLQPDEAFVDIFFYQPAKFETPCRYGAMVLKNEGISFCDLGEAPPTESLCQEWLVSLSEGGSIARDLVPDPEEGTARPEPELRALIRHSVANPILKKIPPSISRVWICPDRELARIPWSMIISSDAGGQERPISCSQLDSARELVWLRTRKNKSVGDSQMFMVGNIDFENAVSELPETKKEIDRIADLATQKHMQVRILERKQPTRANVLNGMADSQYIHLATHGFFDSQKASDATGTTLQDPLLLSGLIVAKDRGSSTNSFGVVTAEDLVTANLDKCDLVTLSACQTASGAKISGQGLLGLRSAIICGGAKSLLMSLWRVDDKATADFMEQFYQNLWSGNSKIDSLRKAQEQIKRRWPHPRFWAPWVLVGE